MILFKSRSILNFTYKSEQQIGRTEFNIFVLKYSKLYDLTYT